MAKRKPRQPALPPANSYWVRSSRPLASLFFLAPLLVAYEMGVMIYATDYQHGVAQHIYARTLLAEFFEWFGIHVPFLAGLIVVVLLLTWHFVRRDPWDFEPSLYLVMAAEAVILAVPLLVLMVLAERQLVPAMALQAVGGAGIPGGSAAGGVVLPANYWPAELVFSIGAGIYEELLFRVVAIAALHWLLVDVIELSEVWGATAAIGASAVLFALYHFAGPTPFSLVRCLLLTLGGFYLAAVYVLRGFGIAAGTHAMYDILVVALKAIG